MLSVVKMQLKGEVEGHALDSHGNYIVDHGKSWKNHGIVFLNFCGNPALGWQDNKILCTGLYISSALTHGAVWFVRCIATYCYSTRT